nr:unnamed protein product [Digitaria exilis]
MADADGSVSVPVPWRRGDFARGSSLRASSALDPLLRGADRLSSEMKRFKELAGLEPLVDEAERRAKEADWLQYLRQMARYRVHRERMREAEDKIRDNDPKQGGEYFNRIDSSFIDLTRFDLDEESPLGPMRFTDTVYKSKDDYELCEGINFFSVRIAVSDVGFPIHVYGTVIARDSLDPRCVYLFRRDRDHCQLINSEV